MRFILGLTIVASLAFAIPVSAGAETTPLVRCIYKNPSWPVYTDARVPDPLCTKILREGDPRVTPNVRVAAPQGRVRCRFVHRRNPAIRVTISSISTKMGRYYGWYSCGLFAQGARGLNLRLVTPLPKSPSGWPL